MTITIQVEHRAHLGDYSASVVSAPAPFMDWTEAPLNKLDRRAVALTAVDAAAALRQKIMRKYSAYTVEVV
jgi:hypothetical protein